MEREDARQVFDRFRDGEDHRLGVPVLHPRRGAVRRQNVRRHCQVLDIGNLVGRNQPGAQRPEGVAALRLRFTGGLLPGALRHVVYDAESRHVVQRVLLVYIFAAFPND